MIALHTEQRFEVGLCGDLPPGDTDSPRVIVRPMTWRNFMEFERLIAAAHEAQKTKDGAAEMNHLLVALGLTIVGWRNVGASSFDLGLVPDMLTYQEAWRLAYRVMDQQLTGDDVKNSGSQSPPQAAAADHAPGAPTANGQLGETVAL